MTAVVYPRPSTSPMSHPTPVPIAAGRLKDAKYGHDVKAKKERPCDACRRRKSRCVIQPGALLCVLCEFHHQECTFVQDPQPRKRKSEVERKEEKKRPSTETIPHDSQKPAKPSNGVDTLGLQLEKRSSYIGPTTAFDPTLINLSSFDSRNESVIELGTLRRVGENDCFIMFHDNSLQGHGEDADSLRAIELVVAPYGRPLIDIFFRTVHPSFPIVQKRISYERLRSHDWKFAPALLASMYILALNWWGHDPYLAGRPKPDVPRLEEIALNSLQAAIKRPKLSTVQAGLLLLQRPKADSWSLATQLVAIGQEIGLHLDCSSWAIPAWERGLRKRVACALYMQDKWSSLIHGRPSHIFKANWAVKSIQDEDFVESEDGDVAMNDEDSEEEKGQTLFAQMMSLTDIMAEIMDTFYTQVAMQEFKDAGKAATRLILDRAKPVQIKLKEWFANLPKSTRMDVEGRKLSPTGYLHLAYFATEITLHRRIIQSLEPAADPYLEYICRSAAKTRLISAMDFVNRLKPEHLQAFWYHASKINFTLIGTFGSLLWATAPAREEADFYRTRLAEYRWTLSVSSRRAEFLDYAVQMLDASRAMLSNLTQKPPLAQAMIASAGVPPTLSSSSSSTADSRSMPPPPRPILPDDDDLEARLNAGTVSEEEQRRLDAAIRHLSNYPGQEFTGFLNEQIEQYDHDSRAGPPE